MRIRAAIWLGWCLWLMSIVSFALGLLLAVLNGMDFNTLVREWFLVISATIVSFSTVGAFIIARRPQNLIGWLLYTIGAVASISLASDQYAKYTLITVPDRLPLGVLCAWLANWIWYPILGLLSFVLLLFPSGHLLSARWRSVIWLAVLGSGVGVVAQALLPVPVAEGVRVVLENPLGPRDPSLIVTLKSLFSAAQNLVAATMLAASLSLLLRFRWAAAEERQQIKWLAYSGVVAVVVMITGSSAGIGRISNMVMAIIPLAVGMAILRYRLYDIDLIIRRTLIYSLLTGTLVLAYFAIVVLLQQLFRALTGQDSDAAIVISTLIIAALFNPLRQRIQAFIDRRFYRRKYDAAQVLAAFGQTVRDEVDLDKLTGELLRVIDETVQPAHVSLWLREPEVKR